MYARPLGSPSQSSRTPRLVIAEPWAEPPVAEQLPIAISFTLGSAYLSVPFFQSVQSFLSPSCPPVRSLLLE